MRQSRARRRRGALRARRCRAHGGRERAGRLSYPAQLAGERNYWCHHPTNRNVPNLLRNTLLAHWLGCVEAPVEEAIRKMTSLPAERFRLVKRGQLRPGWFADRHHRFLLALWLLGALPVFWLARKLLESQRAGLGFALAYLLYPATEWLTLNEFHPVALACPLLLYAFWYLDEERLLPFALFALAASACKEEIALVVAGFGIWYAVAHRSWVTGAAIALTSTSRSPNTVP